VAQPPSMQVSRVVRALGRRRSECVFHRHYVCPSVPTQNERDGLAGGEEAPDLPYPISWSQSRTSVNDGNCIRHLTYLCAVSAVM